MAAFAKYLNSIASEFDDHLSIKKIKKFSPDTILNDFIFENISIDIVRKETLSLNFIKSFTNGSIQQQFWNSVYVYVPYLTKSVNYVIVIEGNFPAELRRSEVIPIFKKDNLSKKVNYRPAGLWKNDQNKQMKVYIENISKFIIGFKKS